MQYQKTLRVLCALCGEKDMDLSVVIVNWNTRELLAQCLEAVYAHPPDCAFDVWVVDNASSDGSAAMVRERFPQVHLIENRENVGFARANNQAIRQSTGRYVLLLNSDAFVQPQTINRLLSFMESMPHAGAAGARTLNPDGTPQECYGRVPTVLRELFDIPRWEAFLSRRLGRRVYGVPLPFERPFEVGTVTASCLIVRRYTIEKVGMLDERFFMYSEEVDWYVRMQRAGWKLFCVPAACAIHHWGGSASLNREAMILQLYRSKYLYFRKHGGKWAEALLRYGLAVRFAAKGLFYRCRSSSEARRTAELQFRLLREMLHPVGVLDGQ